MSEGVRWDGEEKEEQKRKRKKDRQSKEKREGKKNIYTKLGEEGGTFFLVGGGGGGSVHSGCGISRAHNGRQEGESGVFIYC